ncbi:hypothetical protein Tco_0492783 [Tanacetum coccineum]
MVAYLKKTEGSEGFYQIVDFLNASHIQYALTENPTIYVSLIQQFWQTATASTLDNEEMEITATIDGKVKIVTEASIRMHLKLEDSDGLSNLPTTEIFEQLALMGRITRHETEVPQPSSPPPTNVADEAASTRVDVRHGGATTTVTGLETGQDSDEAASTRVDVRHGGATTTVTGLETGQDSGNIDKTPTMPHDSPLPRVNTLRSDEGSMKLQELMDLCTKLSNKGRHEHDMESNFEFTGAEEVYTAKKGVSTAEPVSTVGASVSTASASSAKDKAALRLQEQLDAEERQRISRVHEAASSFNIEEWEDIQARIEADEELAYYTLQQLRGYSFDEIKRLFKPDADDELWKSQKHIHDITWRLYNTCGVHHVSTKDGLDIYMLIEREYPLSRGVLTQMLVAKLLVEQNNEMSKELLRKIFM